MVTLPEKQRKQIKQNLTKEKEQVKKSLTDLKLEDPFTNPDHVSDTASTDTDAFEQSSHERISSIQDELNQRITSITHALVRMEEGTYGTCEICAKAIPFARLRIMPTATICIACEKKKEAV